MKRKVFEGASSQVLSRQRQTPFSKLVDAADGGTAHSYSPESCKWPVLKCGNLPCQFSLPPQQFDLIQDGCGGRRPFSTLRRAFHSSVQTCHEDSRIRDASWDEKTHDGVKTLGEQAFHGNPHSDSSERIHLVTDVDQEIMQSFKEFVEIRLITQYASGKKRRIRSWGSQDKQDEESARNTDLSGRGDNSDDAHPNIEMAIKDGIVVKLPPQQLKLNLSKLTSKEKKRIIRSFVAGSPPEWMYWSPFVVTEISDFLDLSPKTIRRSAIIGRVERRFGMPSEEITDTQKDILRTWISENGRAKPNQRELAHLLQKLKCSKQQFIDMWKQVTQTPGQVDESSKQKLRTWLKSNTKHPQDLSKDDRNNLQKITGWSRTQLHRQLQIIRQGENRPITDEAREIILQWLRNNDYRTPSTAERDALEKETQLARRQVDNLIAHLRQTQVPISAETRLFISAWLRENNGRRPDRQQRVDLLEKTGLASWQLTSIISQDILSFSKGEITKETKQIVQEWIEKNGRRRPTSEEKQMLLSQTGWNQKQLSNTMRNLRRKLDSEQGKDCNIV